MNAGFIHCSARTADAEFGGGEFVLFLDAAEEGDIEFEADRPDRRAKVIKHVEGTADVVAETIGPVGSFKIDLREALVFGVAKADFVLSQMMLADEIIGIVQERVLGCGDLIQWKVFNFGGVGGDDESIGEDGGVEEIGGHPGDAFDYTVLGFGVFGLALGDGGGGLEDVHLGGAANVFAGFAVAEDFGGGIHGLRGDLFLLLHEIKIPIGGFGLGDDEHHLLSVFLEGDIRSGGGEADAGHGGGDAEILEKGLGDGYTHEGFEFRAVLLYIIMQVAEGGAGLDFGADWAEKLNAGVVEGVLFD